MLMIAAFLFAGATLPAAAPVRRMPAPEAKQGVASGAGHIYVTSNDEIGKYDAAGRRVAHWQGDPAQFRHMNSCAVVRTDLVCAASNYPDVPMASSVEIFDARTLRHKATRSLPPLAGSLTVLDWHDGSWWAIIANYDGRGGVAGIDHRATRLLRLDAEYRPLESWLFPPELLERFAPFSASGGAWNADGLFYVTGHDRPELYAVRLPAAGSTLELVATIPIATNGQAIDWDERDPRLLWSIERGTRELVASRVPPIP